MNKKITLLTAFLLFCIFILASCSGNKKQISDDAYIEKTGDKFNFIYDGEENAKWKFFDVDSIAMVSGSFLILGKKDESEPRKWFAIGTPLLESQHAIDKANGIKDKGIYSKKKSAKQMWEE